MATVTPTNAAAPDTSPHADLIEEHVRRTQSYLRSSDIASAAVTILVFVLGFLIATTVVDHWLWPGGLGKAPRLLACALMVVTVSVYAWYKLIPYVYRRINPVYAADRLEHAQPTLMNSLVNLLLLKSEQRPVPAAVMRGLERQAASGIAELPAEAAIDRKRLLRVGYVLIGLVLFAALYLLFSPKSPFPSVARILLPLANIDPVTRVQIGTVQPGTKDVYRGDPVTVTAEVRNLRDDEAVTLRYSSLDAQAENQSVTMHRGEGQPLFSCQLPPDPAGMQRDLVYHIEAGDARSKEFKLHVVPAPTLQIEGIEYQYPAYTGLPSLSVERQGDIKALEGTKVVIRAKASQPIKSATIELRGPKDSALAMQTRGEEAARVELPLKLIEVHGERQAQYTSYKVTMTNEHGDANRDPAEYRIDVTPDLPPQVDIVEPKERVVDLPVDKELPIEVRARDADFALSDVRLAAMRNDDRLFDKSLTADRKIRLDQPVKVAYQLVPAQHGLKPGDEVLLRAVAIDNKVPRPNRQQTPEVRVRIVAGDALARLENGERKASDNGRSSSDPKGDPQGANKSARGEQGKGGEKHDSQPADNNSDKRDRGTKKQDGSAGNQEDKPQDSGSAGGSDKSADQRELSKEDQAQGKQGSQGGPGSKGSESPSDGKQDEANSADKSAGSENSASGAQAQPRDPVDDPEAVQQIVDHIEKQQQKQNQNSQQTAQQKQHQSGDDKQMASADKQSGNNQSGSNESKNQNQGEDKQGQQQAGQPQGSPSQNKKQETQQKRGLKDQGNQQGSQGQGGGKQGAEQQSGENQGAGGGQQSAKSDGKQPGQTQSSQSSTGMNGQAGQPGQQGNSGSQTQGDFSGMGQRSSTDQQQTAAKSDPQNSKQGDRGQESGARSQGEKKSDQSSKGQGTPQPDMNRSDNQPGDQTAQNQAGQNQAGQNQTGSRPKDDTSAASQQRGGDKTQGQGKTAETKDQNASTAEKSNQPGNAADKPKQADSQQPASGDQLASNDTSQKQNGAKSSAQKQSGEGGSANQQQGGKADGGQRQGMNPQQQRDPQPKAEKSPDSGTGGKPQSGGPQGKQQDDGNASDGMHPKDDAQQIAHKSGESSDNRASGKPTNTPQDKAHASNNTPGKQQGMPSDSQSNEEDAKNPERQRPSSTGSGESGEKAGQGKQGQGQQASGAGGGSAGKNQAADDGGNRSQQSGPGDQSNRAGTQQHSDKPTGQAGQQAGDARAGRPQDAQQQPRDSQNQSGGQDAVNPADGAQPTQPGQGQQGHGATKPGKGAATSQGGLGEQAGSSGPSPGGAPLKEGDDPNLAYARRATDLTLRYLQDELAKGRVDDNLRKRLGWSDEEFQSLLKRMQAMRDRGTDSRSRPEDKQAYEQWLKSLGLRPSTGAVRTGSVEAKKFNDARDDAPVNVPRDLREQHEAFRRGLLEKP